MVQNLTSFLKFSFFFKDRKETALELAIRLSKHEVVNLIEQTKERLTKKDEEYALELAKTQFPRKWS